MDNKDLEEVKGMLSIVQEPKEKELEAFDPVLQVQGALADFLQARLKKLQGDVDFEEQIRRSITVRMPEASFPELLRLLDIFQTNNNISVEKVLSPFIPRAGDRVPLLDDKKMASGKDVGDLSKEMTKDLTSAFQELGSLINSLKKDKKEDIKGALEL